MYNQLELFQDNLTANYNKCFFSNIKKSGLIFENANIGDITFKGAIEEPIHRWYRLTPSFSPNLVRYFIEKFNISEHDIVLDPFCGRGTTIIECQKKGIIGYGIEINPTLQRSGNYSLFWKQNNTKHFSDYLQELSLQISKYREVDIDRVVSEFNTKIPIIHNVYRWWRKDVLKDLIIARELARNKKYDNMNKYLWLAVNKVSIDCANIHRNHPTITFDDNHDIHIDVFSEIKSNLNDINNDLESLSEKQLAYSGLNEIKLANSTQQLRSIIPQKITKIITSPPYPNRFSYVHQTRPQLYFMELIDNRSEATMIDLNAIGGTWGRATSILQKELLAVPNDMLDILDYYDELKEKSILMCNYATKYFMDLRLHIKNLKTIIGKNFQGAYVVGNSRLSGVEIFTEVILAKIFQMEGFSVEKIISFRKRGGRKKLYESAVCVRN